MKNKLPNFLIVGAPRSGTTSLHNYLNQHPDIFLPSYREDGMKVKEPRFFIKDIVKNRVHNGIWSWKEYQSLFEKVTSEKMIGESTALYLYYYDLAIKNIKSYLGDNIKIIIILRNPVERAFSAYNHVSRGVKENLSFEKALNIESSRLKEDPSLTPMVMYKDMGLYYKMVKAFKSSFKNVHVILYDELKNDADIVVSNVLSFLGLDLSHSINTSIIHNKTEGKWRFLFLKRLFFQSFFFRKLFRLVLPYSIRNRIRSIFFFFFKEDVQEISPETSKALKSFFKKDILFLEKLLSVNLENWK